MSHAIECARVQIPGSVLKQKNSGQGYQCIHFSTSPIAIMMDNSMVYRNTANVSYLVLKPGQNAIVTMSHTNSEVTCLSIPGKWDYASILDGFQNRCCYPKNGAAERILGILRDAASGEYQLPDLALSHLLVSFLYILLDASDYNSDFLSKYTQSAIAIIRSEYASTELTVSSVAQRLYISPPYLGKLFKEECGTSFSCYLQNYRLTQAQERLLHTYKLLNEIAFETGFVNASHFSTCFRKRFGMSPTQYRKIYKVSSGSVQTPFSQM